MPAKMGTIPLFLLLTFMPVLLSQRTPARCADLLDIISNCSCESAMINNEPDITKVVINCRGLGLTQVPTITGTSSHEIYEMTLAQNNIVTIPAQAFKGLRVQRLDLRENRLTTIENKAFEGLEADLTELHIGAEAGANVQPPLSALTNLTNLRTLTLEYFHFANDGLEPGGLNLLTGLKTLSLRHNGIVFVEPQSVPLDLESIEMDHQSFSSLPLPLLRDHRQLKSVTITNTEINEITQDAFEMNTVLTRLDLGYNKITRLYADCFKGIETKLQYLSLRNNPIPDVQALSQIQKLSALHTLQLSEISLTTLPANAAFLQNKPSLSALYLDGNQLPVLAANVFSAAGSSLATLSLSNNQIASMDGQSLTELTSLQKLDLSHQNIGSSQLLTLPASLSLITSLQELNVAETPLTEAVLWSTVSKLTALTVLRADYTGLSTIQDYALKHLKNLQEVSLDHNRISVITQAMLAGPRKLTKLHLSKNQIQTISNCALYQFQLNPALKLYLINNPLNCDCKLKWLLEHRDSQRIELSGAETCAQPADKAGQLLSSYTPSDMTCSSEWTPDVCDELYTTTTSTTLPTTTPPDITITITNYTQDTIRIIWFITNGDRVSYYRVRVSELEASNSVSMSGDIDKSQTYYTAQRLLPGKSYSLCVYAYSPKPSSQLLHSNCIQQATKAEQSPVNADDNSKEIGILAGVIVAGVVLIVLIIAIIYFVFYRQKTKQPDLPTQAHVFAPSELPSMGAEAKRFTRPKPQPKVGRALDHESINVKVISDGKTGPSSPAERLSAGSYQYLDQKHPQPFPNVQPSTSHYANDVQNRSLPAFPAKGGNTDSTDGYYQMDGNAKPPKHHTYNHVNN